MLDFQKRKKKYFEMGLHDGTKLKIPVPTIAVYASLQEIAANQDNAGEEELTGVLRDVLNNNKQGIKITDEQLGAFDLDDIYELFIVYTQFVSETLSDPNSKSPIAR